MWKPRNLNRKRYTKEINATGTHAQQTMYHAPCGHWPSFDLPIGKKETVHVIVQAIWIADLQLCHRVGLKIT